MNAAHADATTPGDMATLRSLSLSLRPYVFDGQDEDLRFLAFFLTSYVDSVFMDLLGDLPDDDEGVLLKVRTDFFVKLSAGLSDLTSALQRNSDTRPALEQLVAAYVGAVNSLNHADLKQWGVR